MSILNISVIHAIPKLQVIKDKIVFFEVSELLQRKV